VLGRPLGQSAEQAGLLTQAAGVLLSAGQSVTLQEQIKSRLGLSTLELHNRTSTTSYMGYTPVTPSRQTANSAAATTEGLSRTILTVGKYLTPQLYISYGRSIFTGENSFLLRYDIFRNWQIETQTGNESGADLYYRIEFN
jgi:translocation and assembly module TamB